MLGSGPGRGGEVGVGNILIVLVGKLRPQVLRLLHDHQHPHIHTSESPFPARTVPRSGRSQAAFPVPCSRDYPTSAPSSWSISLAAVAPPEAFPDSPSQT